MARHRRASHLSGTEELSRAIAALRARYPSHSAVRVTVGPVREAAAVTVGNLVTLSPRLLAAPAWPLVPVPGGEFLPAAVGHSLVAYVLAHEWGHTAAAVPFLFGFDPAGAPSAYGRRSPAEARAEAFAEWYLSGGATGHAFTRALAARYGW